MRSVYNKKMISALIIMFSVGFAACGKKKSESDQDNGGSAQQSAFVPTGPSGPISAPTLPQNIPCQNWATYINTASANRTDYSCSNLQQLFSGSSYSSGQYVALDSFYMGVTLTLLQNDTVELCSDGDENYYSLDGSNYQLIARCGAKTKVVINANATMRFYRKITDRSWLPNQEIHIRDVKVSRCNNGSNALVVCP